MDETKNPNSLLSYFPKKSAVSAAPPSITLSTPTIGSQDSDFDMDEIDKALLASLLDEDGNPYDCGCDSEPEIDDDFPDEDGDDDDDTAAKKAKRGGKRTSAIHITPKQGLTRSSSSGLGWDAFLDSIEPKNSSTVTTTTTTTSTTTTTTSSHNSQNSPPSTPSFDSLFDNATSFTMPSATPTKSPTPAISISKPSTPNMNTSPLPTNTTPNSSVKTTPQTTPTSNNTTPTSILPKLSSNPTTPNSISPTMKKRDREDEIFDVHNLDDDFLSKQRQIEQAILAQNAKKKGT